VVPAEVRGQPALRTSAGAGAVLGADGELLAISAAAGDEPAAISDGEEPA